MSYDDMTCFATKKGASFCNIGSNNIVAGNGRTMAVVKAFSVLLPP